MHICLRLFLLVITVIIKIWLPIHNSLSSPRTEFEAAAATPVVVERAKSLSTRKKAVQKRVGAAKQLKHQQRRGKG
jgi:hypothetical protein